MTAVNMQVPLTIAEGCQKGQGAKMVEYAAETALRITTPWVDPR